MSPQVEFSEFSKQEVCNLLMFHDHFESFDWTLISLRALALALTLAGLTDFTGTGQRKKAKGSRRTTLKKPLAFSLYPLTYLGSPTLPQMSLRDMSVHKTEETPQPPDA